jgi:hypothetical protein
MDCEFTLYKNQSSSKFSDQEKYSRHANSL